MLNFVQNQGKEHLSFQVKMDCPLPIKKFKLEADSATTSTTKNETSIQESNMDENFVGVCIVKTEEFDFDEFSSIEDPLEVSETRSKRFLAESNVERVENSENSTIKQFNQSYLDLLENRELPQKKVQNKINSIVHQFNQHSEKQPIKNQRVPIHIYQVQEHSKKGNNASRVSVCSPLSKSETSVERKDIFLVKKDNLAQHDRVKEAETETHIEKSVKRKYVCSRCDFATSAINVLLVHVKEVHEKKTLHKCSQCQYTHTEKRHIFTHFREKHEGTSAHRCGKCDYVNIDKEQVLKHWQSVHKGIELFKCSVCRDEFTHKSHLQMHINKYQHDEKRHMCSICGKGFSHKGFLKGHIALNHEIKTQEYK